MYENYLKDVLDISIYRICPKVLEILQVGATTFDHRQGPSYREGYVQVRYWSDADKEVSIQPLESYKLSNLRALLMDEWYMYWCSWLATGESCEWDG